LTDASRMTGLRATPEEFRNDGLEVGRRHKASARGQPVRTGKATGEEAGKLWSPPAGRHSKPDGPQGSERLTQVGSAGQAEDLEENSAQRKLMMEAESSDGGCDSRRKPKESATGKPYTTRQQPHCKEVNEKAPATQVAGVFVCLATASMAHLSQ
jgi:hypothetical protein